MKKPIVCLTLTLVAATTLADPMRPLVMPSRAASAAAVSAPRPAPAAQPLPPLVAIRSDSEGRRQALLGERWLSEGDRIAQATVVSIDALRVQVRQGRTETTLHLLPPLQAATEPEQLAQAPIASRPRAPGSVRR